MGIAAKSRRAAKRKAERRAKKEARRTLYKRYSEEGRVKGSRRSTKRARVPEDGRNGITDARSKLVGPNTKCEGRCGNIGCAKDYPDLARKIKSKLNKA